MRPDPARPAAPGLDSERKTLRVPRSISLTGRIASCDRLIVEGSVETALEGTREFEVSRTGRFRGTVDVGTADIAGTVEASVTAREDLTVRATGRIAGDIVYAALTVERGTVISGRIRPLSEEEDRPAGLPSDLWAED